mgnify:CR=1 FL=1
MKYRILTPIRHGGKRIEPPAVVELTLVEAAPLLAAGVIERAADTPAQGWLALDAQTITSKQAKDVFAEMLKSGKKPQQIIREQGLSQVSDIAAIEKLVDEVFAANPQAIADWKKGKTNVAGWLMGQVMKQSRGKANPNQTTELVQKKLAAL